MLHEVIESYIAASEAHNVTFGSTDAYTNLVYKLVYQRAHNAAQALDPDHKEIAPPPIIDTFFNQIIVIQNKQEPVIYEIP